MQEEYIDDLCVADIATQSVDSLLESLSLEIMETSITDQITSGNNSNRDFLSTIINKFNAIIENATTEQSRGIKDEMIEWSNRLILTIVNEYNLAYNSPAEETLESIDILESLYNFFVIDRRHHTKEFFIKYIDINKKQIIEAMDIGGRGTDITTIANKKKNISKYNVPILSNLTEVIQYIMNSCDIDTEEFFNIIDNGDLYTSNVRYYFESDMLMGDFFYKYVEEEVSGYADDISTELRTAIRINLSI